MSDPMDFNAATALAAMQETREAWAGRGGHKGVRYDVLYGLIVGATVGGQALPTPFNVVASLGGAAVLSLVAVYWARRTGVWINGAGPRRARWVSLGFATLFILAACAVYWAAHAGMAWVGWPGGILAAVIGTLAARLWRRVYRSDIADGTDTRPGGIGHRPFTLMVGFGAAIVLAAVGIGYGTHALDSVLFFYALGAGVGVISAAVAMVAIRALIGRLAR